MLLWYSNWTAQTYLEEYEGGYEHWDTQDGVEIYFLMDPDLQELMDVEECVAFTVGEYICFRDEESITDEILAHEMTHVEQERTVPAFPLMYWLADMLFEHNPYELEAEIAEHRVAKANAS